MNRVLVVAEPGGTAEGNYGSYVGLIHAAHMAGVDCFKVQWCSNPEQMCERRHITTDHPKRAYYLKAYSWLSFPVAWHAEFAKICNDLGMQYGATSFLPEDVAIVDPFVNLHKIASFENQDHALLEAALDTGKRVIVSAGMVAEYGYASPEGDEKFIERMHCVSAYPAPLDELNLACIDRYRLSGFSDHSRDIDMGGFAVCAGAKIIEAHLRLYDCSSENPDYPAAFDPGEFAMYVSKIRKAERALGDGIKRVQPSEEWALPYRVAG